MALLHIHYYSAPLEKQMGMFVVLPDETGPYRTVYLLHGLSDDYTMWQRRTSIERYADKYGLMVVMLDGDRSFYCNLPHGLGDYETHILESVRFIDRTFHTIDAPEGRGIGGLSMGGYGSMKLALKYPELFGSVAAHSGVLDIANTYADSEQLHLETVFGPDGVSADEDCFRLAERPGAKPAIRFDCGDEDFLLQHNRDFHAHLTALGIPHEYEEFPGTHEWGYWDAHIPAALAFHRRTMTRTGDATPTRH